MGFFIPSSTLDIAINIATMTSLGDVFDYRVIRINGK